MYTSSASTTWHPLVPPGSESSLSKFVDTVRVEALSMTESVYGQSLVQIPANSDDEFSGIFFFPQWIREAALCLLDKSQSILLPLGTAPYTLLPHRPREHHQAKD